ncbi:MAG: RodZ domain-containing protein [Bacteroidota bacterium]
MSSSNPISERLRQARQEQNLSLEEMSEITKIRPHILESLEAGELETLAPTYTKSFIKTYARALGIPLSIITQLIEADEKLSQDYYERQTEKRQLHNQEIAKTKAASVKSYGAKRTIVNLAPRRARKVLFFVVPILLVAGLVAGAFFLKNKVDTIQIDPVATDSMDVLADGSDTSKTGKDSVKKEETLLDYFAGTESVADSLILEAATSDSAWISIVMDGQRSEQLILTPGNPRRWSAQKLFTLTVGNAGAVVFKRNGEQLPPLGKKGSVVRMVRITEDDVTTSANPWKTPAPKPKPAEPAKP